MTAADVVTRKALLASDLATPGYMSLMDGWLEHEQSGPFPSALMRGRDGAHECLDMANTLAVGESYYVAANMVELAIHASAGMPDEPLLPYDPPSTHGFMWLAIPFRMIDIRAKMMSLHAIMWATRGGQVKVWWLTDKYDPDDSTNVIERARAGEAGWAGMPQLTPNHIGGLRFGQQLPRGLSWDTALPPEAQVEIEVYTTEDGRQNVRFMTDQDIDIRREPIEGRSVECAFLVTLWRLCQQTIATRTREDVNPRLGRILRKANLPERPVTVIALRKRSGQHGDSTVEWTHRWVVRGHWRRQPCKDADGTWTHRMVYINPYLKGPDDAPLLVREHVNALVR
jgi:hypothetical protein